MSGLIISGVQIIASSASVLPMNIQGWFPSGLDIPSPCSPRDSQESSPTPQLKSTYYLVLSLLYGPTITSTHYYWKNRTFNRIFVCQVMSLLFNTLSRFVIAFLPRSKCLSLSLLLSPSAMIQVCHCFHCFPIYLPWSDGIRCHDLSFLMLSFKLAFFTLLFHSHQESL